MKTRENILYILGAGFSAPLGIPVMRDFYQKSKDMYTDVFSGEYRYFNEVFKEVSRMSNVLNYMDANLFNIEEILSIIEMKSYVSKSKLTQEKFANYIKDVISFYTPEIKNIKYNSQNYWDGWDLNTIANDNLGLIGKFVANLIGLQINIRMKKATHKLVELEFNSEIYDRINIYSLISLNYDMVVENWLDHFYSRFNLKKKYPIKDQIKRGIRYYDDNSLCFAKIHGTLKPLNIVAPTWNKTQNEKLRKVWKMAFFSLREATQIRFIGYSLPESDNHIKYLLINGIMLSDNLKNIDVLCMDKDGSVEQRYRRLFKSRNLDFKNLSTEEYLSGLIFNAIKIDNYEGDNNAKLINGQFHNLEEIHRRTFERG
ncbi:MAG: hypothetical protein H8E46_09380 [FCB group bacterium]|nr:hypothetical protein [FCB group bacterium]